MPRSCLVHYYNICGFPPKLAAADGIPPVKHTNKERSRILGRPIWAYHIIFYTEFLDSEQEPRCKHVRFGDLSRVNTHLPLVRITQSDKASNIEKERLKKLQNRLNNCCLLTNKATRLVIFSHIRCDGSFGCLPRELVSVILKHYYQ